VNHIERLTTALFLFACENLLFLTVHGGTEWRYVLVDRGLCGEVVLACATRKIGRPWGRDDLPLQAGRTVR